MILCMEDTFLKLSDEYLFSGPKFTSCILEMVRTFLADWIHTRPSNAPEPDWTPQLPTNSIELPGDGNQSHSIWECQRVLQEEVSSMGRSNANMPASPHLIMLLILGFPCTAA